MTDLGLDTDWQAVPEILQKCHESGHHKVFVKGHDKYYISCKECDYQYQRQLGLQTHKWNTFYSGPMIDNTEEKIIPMNLGRKNDWQETPAMIKKCNAAGHTTRYWGHAGGTKYIACDICLYEYSYDGRE